MLSLLEGVRATGEDTYVSDVDTRLKTERALQLAVQICIDVGAHLIAERGLEQPDDNRGVFAVLERSGLIDAELARRLGDAAGLRKLLVHGYADLDDAQVWGSLAGLDDFRMFAAAAARSVSEE